jgi:hypothetical protein
LPEPARLAFKAYEIEELADRCFFRPLGLIVAMAAQKLGLTPTVVTIAGTAIGVAGGALLYVPHWGWMAFALIILHSVLDSSDGQLARMTGRTSEFGRLLDGLSGAFTHVAIYVAIAAGALASGSDRGIIIAMFAAAVATLLQAQLYDYHRSSYTRVVIQGRPRALETGADGPRLLNAYEAMERRLAGAHPRVEALLAERAADGMVRESDRAAYRHSYYWPVRGWNLMGDNTRFYLVGLLVWMDRLPWFFAIVLVPMTLAWILLWIWQASVDRRFLRAVIG